MGEDSGATPHDLQRTLSTSLEELGVSNKVIDQILNHRERSRVRRTYNRYAFAAEKVAALTRWDRRVREIVKGETSEQRVVQLHASQGF